MYTYDALQKKSIRELKNSLGKSPTYKFNFNYFIVKVPTSTYLPLYPGLDIISIVLQCMDLLLLPDCYYSLL